MQPSHFLGLFFLTSVSPDTVRLTVLWNLATAMSFIIWLNHESYQRKKTGRLLSRTACKGSLLRRAQRLHCCKCLEISPLCEGPAARILWWYALQTHKRGRKWFNRVSHSQEALSRTSTPEEGLALCNLFDFSFFYVASLSLFIQHYTVCSSLKAPSRCSRV